MVLSFLKVTEKLWFYLALFCGQNIFAIIGTFLGVIQNFGIKSFFYANLLSFFIFSPFFFHHFLKNFHFSKIIFIEQLKYSIPLLAYNIIYTGFYSVDRLCIQKFLGYEALGVYSLLWKFGSIFQIISIAMIDTAPILFFNAHKETNGNFLISKLITYFCIALTSFCLIAIVIARCTIAFAFPYKYFFLIQYLPLFFLPLVILEIARVLQIGFSLALKTIYIPILSLITLTIQIITLFFSYTYGICGILGSNSLTFLFYALLNYYVSSKIYTQNIIDYKKIISLCIFFSMYLVIINFLFMYSKPWYYLFLILSSWPIILWCSNIIAYEEKRWIKNIFFTHIKIV